MKPNAILFFDKEYAFLSNFFESPIEFKTVDGKKMIAPTVEHAFQAEKAMFAVEQETIINADTPGKAKRLGRHCLLRPDWEDAKDNVMLEFVRRKFQIPELRDKLLATGTANLVEGNNWHDNYWGICVCEKCVNNPVVDGKNKLGSILMRVRDEIREETTHWEKLLEKEITFNGV